MIETESVEIVSHLDHAVQAEPYYERERKGVLHCHTCHRDLSAEEADDYRGSIGPEQPLTDLKTLRHAMIQWAKAQVRNDRPITFVDDGETIISAHYHPSKQAWAWLVLRRSHNTWERYETKQDVLRMLDTARAVLVEDGHGR